MTIEDDFNRLEDEFNKLKAQLEKKQDANPVRVSYTATPERWRVFLKEGNHYLGVFYDEEIAEKCAEAVRRALEFTREDDE